MVINIKDTLTLDDDNEYVVVSKTNYKDKTYYYLLDKNNNKNFMFCYENGEELVESIDKELNAELIPLFLEAGAKELDE